jgi:hypothetical protein
MQIHRERRSFPEAPRFVRQAESSGQEITHEDGDRLSGDEDAVSREADLQYAAARRDLAGEEILLGGFRGRPLR